MANKKKRLIKILLSVLLLGIMLFSAYQLYQIYRDYAAEKAIHDMVLEYKPQDTVPSETETEEPVINQSVIDLQAVNADVVGWLTIPNTNIDYPFVWYSDNDFYLRRDLEKKYAQAGTLFMDYRCNRDFSSQNTIVYGHQMKNNSMFGSIKNFNNKEFFDNNRTGTIFLANQTLELEIFAFLVVKAADKEIYKTDFSKTGNAGFMEYIAENARYFRETPLGETDRFVTLSTCSYEFNNARMVLICRINK